MPHIDVLLNTLPVGVPVRIEDGGLGIVVFRKGDAVSAFEDSCPHARWHLSDGEVCEGVLECPGHGWEFDTATGRCLNVPAYSLRKFEVTTLSGIVSIECPDTIQQVEESTHRLEQFLDR